MKKLRNIGLPVLSLIVAAAALGAWLVCSTAGSRLVMTTIFRLLPVTVEAERIEGHLADDLILEGLRVAWPSGDARVATLRIRLQPLYLLAGTVSLTEMDVRQVFINDNSPESAPPYDLEWPRAPRLLAAIGCDIREFRLEDVSYRKRGRDPVVIDEARGEAAWGRGSVLSVRDVLLRLPGARVEGSLQADFLFPSLQADLTVKPDRDSAKFDSLTLKADLSAGKDPEQVAGTVRMAVLSGTRVQAHVEGEIGMTRKAVHFRNLQWKDGEGRAIVTAEGRVDVSTERILAGASFRIGEVSWIPALSLTGAIEAEGSPDRYDGRIALQNHGEAWRSAQLFGDLSGNLNGIRVSRLTGRLLDGTVEGALRGSWDREMSWTGSLQARALNPAKISPEMRGVINLNVEGAVRWPEAGSPEARVRGELLKSLLRDRALTGAVDARWKAGVLRLDRLFLQGSGFEARAAGSIGERLSWAVQVSDPSALVPGSAGRLSASGWIHCAKERLAGAATVRGSKISMTGVRVSAVEADAELGSGEPQRLEGRVSLKGLACGPVQVGTTELKTTGAVGDHAIRILLESREGKMEAALQGRYEKAVWNGVLETLNGRDTVGSWGLRAPASLVVSAERTSVSPVRIAGTGGESIDFSMEVSGDPMRGFLSARWQKINLARLDFVLPDWQIRGQTEGHFRADFRGSNRTTISSEASLAAGVKRGSHSVDVKEATGKLDWNEGGLTASAHADLGRSGRLAARVTSTDPPRAGLPERGDFRLTADQLDAALLKPFFPEPLSMTGALSGSAAGKLLPRSRLDAAGEVKLTQGAFSLQDKRGQLTAHAQRAQLRWAWREETLSGDLDLLLTKNGSLKADFRLPIPARLPVVIEEERLVRLAARADMREKGLLSALFPGLIQESRGHLELDGNVSGTWAAPDVHGTLKIEQAGAYLPTTCIRVSDVAMEARFEDQAVQITSFRAHSGPGSIEGTGSVRLKNREIHQIEARLSGERFQAVRLPEMEMLASPRLTFEGSPNALKVRGTVTVPELLIRGSEKGTVARPSRDVVMVGEGRTAESGRPVPVDMEVRIILGDRAFVKAEGVDARLEGDVLLTARSLDAMKATGEIRLRDGTYSAKGVRLVITRGRIVFEGGRADQPRLDVLALRTVEERPDQAGQSLGRFREVKAGVIITGTPQAPLVRLYSEPAMSDADVLSYIALGHRASGDASTSAMLGAAAEALLSGGGSESTLSRLKRQFGPDTVEMKSTKVGTATQSIVTVGKYLQPDLYVSYGRSLFNEDYFVTLRYTLSRRWEVESKAGAQTGANLYYRIEFD